ncbi:hypothetical protein NLO85_27525 [Pseudomonas savastanoi]|uniref:Uncharacterized protein n=1 Tax=Pseudomonas savastanoi TaxID=29438 RepID=A0AAW5J9G7_PSESS|nr:hypothetical protein [Pseudomonas savastanoi]MCQ3024178.1 hypothetical protein [Pseudomonas savastanoi]
MELLTTPLPLGYRLVENLGVYSVTSTIQITQKGLIQSFMDRNRNEWSEAYKSFMVSAPRGTTILFGVQVTTAIGVFGNGGFLYVTMTGTAAVHEMSHEQPT